MTDTLNRRAAMALGLASAAGAALATPALSQDAAPATVRNNVSGFQMHAWRDHFDSLGKPMLVADTFSRALHYWNAEGGDHRIFPTSVPISDDLTKRGYTEIVRKKEGPSWTPTPSQMARYPDWKPIGPGPDNPLGTHAMYLSWPAYIIHGTHDTRKIGRRSSDGCIGLYNEMIAELFQLCPVGTRVRVI
ncbi:L,D-transpeptidase [Pseudogemmobacter blasticus]|uniref:Putative L,D-transpeptidase in ATP synthase subunits region ORF 5 n=2 Tax=Fuscovulum blasticum TaxID=1075 RepID=YAT5_FUSBL|nr:L,D-transpeptidase [Fuscovulum blasticum]P05448.1 RecName: Full=Putative L,D-transpeptidase in ATP synthase subunits region ORF 5; Flags: Precursor [Fuscovulum blasticum]PTE13408.1 L,D-transpeptidase [Fuscovulum blasticum DSM 2131]CAA77311.1 URF 5 [Fuscovulum blasticum]